MRIRIFHPGILAEKGIKSNSEICLDGTLSAGDLLTRFGVEEQHLTSVSIVVNGRISGPEAPLADDDEVSFFFAALGG